MVTHHEVQRQLKAIGANFSWWGHSEARELEHVLVPGETITYCLNGRYEGGFAMLCVTDQRIILIDKKPMYLTLEDIRYDMLSEVDFNQRLIDSTIIVCSVNKTLRFTALKSSLLRKATAYIQNRVMEFRHQPAPQQQQAEAQPTATVPLGQTLPQQAIVNSVQPIEHRITNPYTKVPLMMRRRVSRYY